MTDKAGVPKVGLIVRGDDEKMVVEALARATLDGRVARISTIRTRGGPRVRSALPEVSHFLTRGYSTVLYVFDAATDEEAEALVEELSASLPDDERLHLVPAVPSVRHWAMLDVSYLDPEMVAKESPSFARLRALLLEAVQ